MAEIPQYSRHEQAGGSNNASQIGGIPFNPGIGAGLEQVGQSISAIATAGAQHYVQDKAKADQKVKEDQAKFDQGQAIRIFSEFQLADEERQFNFQNSYNGDLTKFADANIQDQKSFFDKFVTEPITPDAQERLNNLYGQHQVQTFGQSLDFQAKSVGLQTRRNFETSANNLVNDTRSKPYTNYWSNQDKLNQLVHTADGKLPEQALLDLKKDYQDQNGIAMIRGKADANPGQTLKELDHGVYNKILSPEAINVVMGGLRREIEAEHKQLQSHYASEIMGRMDDHLHSMMETNTPVIKQADINKIEDPYVREQVQHQFNFNTKVGKIYNSAVKGSEFSPIETQLAIVDKLKPKPGHEGYADDLKAWEATRSAVIEQNKAYAEDPVTGALKNGQVAQAWQRSNGGVEGRRSAIMNQINKGYPISKIAIATNAEVAEYSDQINRLLQGNKFEEAKTMMNNLRGQFNVVDLPGGRTGWDIFNDQLAKSKVDKIPDDFLFAMHFHDIPQGHEIFQAYKVSKADYTSIIGEQSIKDVDKAINANYKPYADVISRIPNFFGTSQVATEKALMAKYAYRLVQSGQNANDAAKNAYKIMKPYDIINTDRKQLVIPRSINGKPINSSYVQSALDRLTHMDLIYSFLSRGIPKDGLPFTLQKLSVKDNFGQNKGGDLYLRHDAAQSFETIKGMIERNHHITPIINDAMRTTAHQTNIYHSGNNGVPVAAPGHSKHEAKNGAIALDIENHAQVGAYFRASGWIQPDPVHDPFHFEFAGGRGHVAVGSMPEQIANEAERKRTSDSVSKLGVWMISPDLRSAVLYQKNKDGSKTPIYNAKNEPYMFNLTDLNEGHYNDVPTHKVGSIINKRSMVAQRGIPKDMVNYRRRNLSSEEQFLQNMYGDSGRSD